LRRLAVASLAALVLLTSSVAAITVPTTSPTSKPPSGSTYSIAPKPRTLLVSSQVSQPTYSPPTPSPARVGPTPVPPETVEQAKAWAQRELSPDDYQALYWIVWSESKWDPAALNSRSGACGLGQFWPCSKMADGLPDWPTQPIAQLRDYVIPYAVNKYGSLPGAWLTWQRRGWW
jgi:hypothetical protein